MPENFIQEYFPKSDFVPGRVISILVNDGDYVAEGQIIMVIETEEGVPLEIVPDQDCMILTISVSSGEDLAPSEILYEATPLEYVVQRYVPESDFALGRVISILVNDGDYVAEGQLIMVIETEEGTSLEIIADRAYIITSIQVSRGKELTPSEILYEAMAVVFSKEQQATMAELPPIEELTTADNNTTVDSNSSDIESEDIAHDDSFGIRPWLLLAYALFVPFIAFGWLQVYTNDNYLSENNLITTILTLTLPLAGVYILKEMNEDIRKEIFSAVSAFTLLSVLLSSVLGSYSTTVSDWQKSTVNGLFSLMGIGITSQPALSIDKKSITASPRPSVKTSIAEPSVPVSSSASTSPFELLNMLQPTEAETKASIERNKIEYEARQKKEAHWVHIDVTNRQSKWKYGGQTKLGKLTAYVSSSEAKISNSHLSLSMIWAKEEDLNRGWMLGLTQKGGELIDKIHSVYIYNTTNNLFEADIYNQEKIPMKGAVVYFLELDEYSLIKSSVAQKVTIQYTVKGNNTIRSLIYATVGAAEGFNEVQKQQKIAVQQQIEAQQQITLANAKAVKVDDDVAEYREKIKQFNLPDGYCGKPRDPSSNMTDKAWRRLIRHNNDWKTCLFDEGKDEFSAIIKLITRDLDGSITWKNSEKTDMRWVVKYHERLETDVKRLLDEHNENNRYRKRALNNYLYQIDEWNDHVEDREFWNELRDTVERATSNY